MWLFTADACMHPFICLAARWAFLVVPTLFIAIVEEQETGSGRIVWQQWTVLAVYVLADRGHRPHRPVSGESEAKWAALARVRAPAWSRSCDRYETCPPSAFPSNMAAVVGRNKCANSPLHDRAAGLSQRRTKEAGSPPVEIASGGRGQRPEPFDSAAVHCDRVNVAPSHALTGHAERQCERGATDAAGFDS
ncbi:MAG: hypothetical protein ACLU1W_09035 [Collinsella sp.]